MRHYKKYIDYDYEDIFNVNLNHMEEKEIEELLKTKAKASVYATKTILSSNQLEIEIYPEFSKKKDITEDIERIKRRKDIQDNLNSKNSRKTLIRLLNTNFTGNDYYITLTYAAKEVPTEERAEKNIKNFLKAINRLRKKKGLENAKYIYVTETRSKDNKPVRIHHHLILQGGLTIDEIKSKWKFGKRSTYSDLDPDEEKGLEEVANYLFKEPKKEAHKKKWHSSKNLERPKIRKNHRTFSNRKVMKMVEKKESIAEIMQKQYNAYFRSVDIRYNEYNKKYYLYVKMYLKD